MITIATKIDALPDPAKALLILISLSGLVGSYYFVYLMGKMSATIDQMKAQK